MEEIEKIGKEEYELRSYHLVEVRAEGEGEAARIEGIAAVYDQPTRINTAFGSYVEVIKPGFFQDVMEDDARALWNHNTDLVLGRKKSGTLELKDQKAGLGTVIHPPDTQWGRDAVTSIKRGDVDQMSFAFTVKEGWDEWKESDGVMVRTLKAGACKQLYDVSPVTFAAYPQTSVAVRRALQDSQRFNLQEQQRSLVEGSHVGGVGQGTQPDQEPEAAQGRSHLQNVKRIIQILEKL
jgi:uncharacterized protein